MSIIYTETLSDKDSRTEIDLGDGRKMTINITGEGIIMDVYERQPEGGDYDLLNTSDEDVHLGTAGMMFDEWAEWVENPSGILNLPDTDCQHCGDRIHVRGVWSDGTGGEGCRSNSHHPASHGRHQP